jgi:antitoxin PrlF
MVKSTVTSKGQITIPKEIRTLAMIHEGTQVDFQLQEDGKILIIPVQRHISQLKGILKTKRKAPVSLVEMKQAIVDAAMESMR